MRDEVPVRLRRWEVDYHCHLIPGVDDGPKTVDESLKMAALLFRAGYRQVHCTPHLIKGVYDISTADVLHEIAALQAVLDGEGIALKLLAGREYFLDEFLLQLIDDPLCLEGTNYLMVEIPGHASVDLVKDVFFRIRTRGFVPLVAHPERCGLLVSSSSSEDSQRPKGFLKSLFSPSGQERSERVSRSRLLHYLIELGCQFQADYGSFTGHYGEQARNVARHFDASALYTHAGTDAHTPRFLEHLIP